MVQFEGVEVEEHSWPLIRTKGQIDKLLVEVEKYRGFVMYTIVDEPLRRYLKEKCQKLNVPCVSVLSRVISDISGFLGVKATMGKMGKQHELDEEYFSRVEAINFSLTHDDGQGIHDLEEADIIIIGVSRSSKSPTSMYLANKGYRVANIPFVKGIKLPESLEYIAHSFIIGLTIDPILLAQIRRNRLLSLNEREETSYTDIEEIKEEIMEVRRLCTKKKWPMIDVTRRSVEETAATILQKYKASQES